MKSIQIKKNYIDIPFEDENGNLVLKTQFNLDDDSIKGLYKKHEELQANKEEIEENIEDEEAIQYLKEAFDSILTVTGEEDKSAFEELYKLNPSSFVMMIYLVEVYNILFEEINKTIGDEKINKYVYGTSNVKNSLQDRWNRWDWS